MRDSLYIRLTTIVVGLAAWVSGIGAAKAQDLIPDKAREELTRPTTGPVKSKPVYVTKTVYVNKNAHPTVTTGTLSVDAYPNAIIRVVPLKGGTALEGTVPKNERLFIFGSLKPGAYLVAATLDGYKPAEQRIQIFANKHKGVTLNLQQVFYTVKINTNVASGEVRYAPVISTTEAGKAEKLYKASGETRVVLIENHSAVLPALPRGTYGVDIRSGEVGFETKLGTITVPDETDGEEVKLEVTLKNLRSTETFNALIADQWDFPPKWRIASSLLSTNGKGLAIPHDPLFRYYTDFQLISDARMVNGVAVSFIARAAVDKEDYYLIRLTGPNAEEPYQLSGFIVKHGVPQRFQSISVNHLSVALKPNKFFKISIKMKANNIEVKLWDSQTGEYYPLGGFADSYANFGIGAVGIAASDKEQAQFGSFIVCTPQCPRE